MKFRETRDKIVLIFISFKSSERSFHFLFACLHVRKVQ